VIVISRRGVDGRQLARLWPETHVPVATENGAAVPPISAPGTVTA
jgi:hypothetical protein